MREAIAKALGGRVTEVEASARLRGPTTVAEGQYVLHMADGDPAREVGLVVYRQSIPVQVRPVFWLNLEDGGQVVLVGTPAGIVREDLPPHWIASDYLADRGDACSIRFLALNPPRTLAQRAHANGPLVLADSSFRPDHPVTCNVQARALFGFAPQSRTIETLALIVHRTRDRVEAETVLGLLECLFAEPGTPA
jgi:hypothetical protein